MRRTVTPANLCSAWKAGSHLLTGRLAITEEIDPRQQDGDRVRSGATVSVQTAEGPEKIYRIVGIDEADIECGHISWTSPLARALLDGRSGDVIKVHTPAGVQELEIVEVCYHEIKRGPSKCMDATPWSPKSKA